MNSSGEMSLEDIIRKKKGKIRNNPSVIPKGVTRPNIGMIDARNRIISKKRTQINDARDKLIQLAKQKDARLKLLQIRKQNTQVQPTVQIDARQLMNNSRQNNNGRKWRKPISEVFTDTSRHVKVNARLGTRKMQDKRQHLMEMRSIRRNTQNNYVKPIIRTVENDMAMDALDDDDPMDGAHHESRLPDRIGSINFKIVAHNDLREHNPVVKRPTSTLRQSSPPRPPSILKKRPLSVAPKPAPVVEKAEYRIIVSNLRNTVSASDIQELFGDVGGMIESRLVRPGTAEVIYKTQEDAQRAVDLYHNRQLDGQPMNCLLVVPRTHSTARNNTVKPVLPPSSCSNVEPDISTIHKVLFSSF